MATILTLEYWRRFIKFNIVGLSGVAVNEGLLLLLASAGMFYVYASAVAVETSIVWNFLLHDFWTFKDRRHGRVVVRLAKFNGLMLIGLALNLAILYAGTEFLGVYYAVSNLLGIAVAFLVRYWLSVRYTWIRKEEESAMPPAAASPPAPPGQPTFR